MTQLQQDLSAAILKAGKFIDALAALLDQPEKKAAEFKKGRKATTRVLNALRKDKKFVEYKKDGPQAKLQRAKQEQNR